MNNSEYFSLRESRFSPAQPRRLALKALVAIMLFARFALLGSSRSELEIGVAGHAFDHLGSIGEQAEAALASGANIIYVSGVGAAGYQGLPPQAALKTQLKGTAEYLKRARKGGIKVAIGYVCATSIVKLDQFDHNWSPDFRARFRSPPKEWRQQNRKGEPLPSWYGGDYVPACMNHPDWRAYERFMVRQQIEAGCDGVFFDNPTVHPEGCFCSWCMDKFGIWLSQEPGFRSGAPRLSDLASLRALAEKEAEAFLRFRCTIARDFLEDMRQAARQIKARALVTANNSLNSADALYAQCRTHGYNIYEMSKVEDLVVVEDMSSQPRTLADGRIIEYGPTLRQLGAISHGKPVVAVAIAEGDYHTAPNLVRLAMAEAAANQASHLWWPTWPEAKRAQLASVIRPQAEFLGYHHELLNGAELRQDVVLFLPFRNFAKTAQCQASLLAGQLSRSNIQYGVICEDAFDPLAKGNGRLPAALTNAKVFLVPSAKDLLEHERKSLEKFAGKLIFADDTGWLPQLQAALTTTSLIIDAPPGVRAVIHDQPKRTLIHLFNLNVQRVDSFSDQVVTARDLKLTVRVPLPTITSARILTADSEGTLGALTCSPVKEKQGNLLEFRIPRLHISAIVVVE